MTPLEAAQVARVVAALCPAQKMDQDTPAAWALVLDDVTYTDAQTAIKNLGKIQTFISPAEIRTEVRRIRAKRISLAGDLTPPADLDELQTRRWLADARQRIGDGEPVDQVNPEIARPIARDVHAITAGIGKAIA